MQNDSSVFVQKSQTHLQPCLLHASALPFPTFFSNCRLVLRIGLTKHFAFITIYSVALKGMIQPSQNNERCENPTMFEDVKYVSGGKFVSRGDWIHPDRNIDSYEIIFMLEGTAYINENGTEYVLNPHDALLLEPNVHHFGFEKSSNVCFYWVHFEGGMPDIPKFSSIENRYHLSLLFSQLLHFSAFDDGINEGNDYLTRLILIELYRNGKGTAGNSIAYRVAEWIRNNSDINVTVQDIAEHFGYNSDYLNRMFKKTHNQSIKSYIAEAKMQFIKRQLMSGELPLTKIAEKCGFSEYKYFLKFFKYHEGMTPTEFVNIYFRTHINNK